MNESIERAIVDWLELAVVVMHTAHSKEDAIAYLERVIETKREALVEHNRWDDEHVKACEDCFSERLDAAKDMAEDAKLDKMIEESEETA